MKMCTKMKRWLAVTAIGISVLVAACGGAPTGGDPQGAGNTPSGGTPEGQVLLEDRCTRCHTLEPIKAQQLTESQWRTVVNQMIQYGAQLDSSEADTLVAYLAETYGK